MKCTKHRVDLLILDSSETVTVNEDDTEDLGIIDEGGVAIANGKIVEVASSQLLERKYSASEYLRVKDEVIFPGFIDPHTHLVFEGSREQEFESRLEGSTYLDVLKKGGGIMETVGKTREATENQLLTTAQDRLNVAFECGTTAIEIKSGYGLTTYGEVKILRTIQRLRRQTPCHISPTFLGAHAIPIGWTEREYTKLIIDQMLPTVSLERLADFCDVFCEKGTFDKHASKTILRAGIQAGLRPKIHADQFTDNGGAELANEVRATSADHIVHSSPVQLKKFKNTNVTPVILPASSHSLLSSQYAPAREMLASGLPVALGSDFSPSNWILGPLTIAAIAARTLRMKSDELIRAITVNAAKALRLDREIGSLRRGKSADIVTLKIPNHRWIGYTYGEGLIDKVLIAGKRHVDKGRRLG
jgi:imidazolonepropionase